MRILLQDHQIIQKITKFRVLCSCQRCNGTYECGLYEARRSRIGHICGFCKNTIVNLHQFDQSALQAVFDYNEVTGELRHKLDTVKGVTGELATYRHSQGYLSLVIGGKEYLAHRVIWMMKKGVMPYQVDHIDHERTNNSWTNLREVTNRENQLNMGTRSNNTSGVVGVRILPSGRFCAFIMVHRKQISLGTYDVLDEAICARKAAEKRYGFHVNHGS